MLCSCDKLGASIVVSVYDRFVICLIVMRGTLRARLTTSPMGGSRLATRRFTENAWLLENTGSKCSPRFTTLSVSAVNVERNT